MTPRRDPLEALASFYETCDRKVPTAARRRRPSSWLSVLGPLAYGFAIVYVAIWLSSTCMPSTASTPLIQQGELAQMQKLGLIPGKRQRTSRGTLYYAEADLPRRSV